MICTFNIFQSQILIRGFQLVHVLSAATEKYVEGLFFSLRKKKIHHRSGFTGWHLAPGTRPDLQQEPLNLGRIGIQLDATWDQTGKINSVRIIS